jgi:aryl-alcohol dehydrogenase-like predicted oxidoreductase
VQRALELIDVGEIQNGYSIVDREEDGMLDFARAREIAFAPFFPLGSAFRGGPGRLAQDPTIAHLEQNMAAAELELDDVAAFDRVAGRGRDAG